MLFLKLKWRVSIFFNVLTSFVPYFSGASWARLSAATQNLPLCRTWHHAPRSDGMCQELANISRPLYLCVRLLEVNVDIAINKIKYKTFKKASVFQIFFIIDIGIIVVLLCILHYVFYQLKCNMRTVIL